ncbi:24508_t:CDS:10 [Dentiscutata erythropus]|uniref:24508_t:CDS:1 n=1 Tax=Dentiscutata erythropus TaxID=1348616 RepID=A0A9N9CND3_9GLOM|nr:24508_t:CDS:10 [Dentiscutata erythropus]
MSKKQLDLMFSQLVQDMEELTADLACDDEKEQTVENDVDSSLKDNQEESSKLVPTFRQRSDSTSHTYSTPITSTIPAKSSTSTTFTTSSPSSSSYSKVTESLSMQPSGSDDVLTNQVKSSISPLDNNSNSLNNSMLLKMNNSTLAKNIFDYNNNYDFDSTKISPLIIPKVPLPSSNISLDILKPKFNRVPTGRRPIKYQNLSEEIPETPTLSQKEKFRTSEIKNVDSEKFKQKEFDDKSLNNSGSRSNLREKDNVPIERIRKDSKVSEYMSDDSKDTNTRSPYARVDRIRKDSKASEYMSDDSKDPNMRSPYVRVERIRKDSKASEYMSDDSKDPNMRSPYVRVERIRKDSKASEYMSDDSKDINMRSPYARVERIRKDSKASEYASDDSKDINSKSAYTRVERIRKDSKASEYTSDDSKDIRSPYVRDGDKSNDYREFSTRTNRIRESEDDDNKPLRGRARSKTNDFEERGRAKSRVDFEERGRAKSKPRETDEKDRAKSRTREVDERDRAKSRTREVDERGRAKSRTREPDERSRAVSRSREYDEIEKSEKAARNKEYGLLMEKHSRREKTKHENEKDGLITSEIKIYVEHIRRQKEISISSTMTALDVLNFFRNNDVISNDDVWALFEIATDFHIDWECLSKAMGTWESEKTNLFTLKKYSHRNSLTLQASAFDNAVPPMFGWLHVEIKKNKWKKRYCQVKDGALYHSKDSKGTNEVLLCSMNSFDVYTCTQLRRRQPTKFGFALKSQEKISLFENPDDYIHFLCADNSEKNNDWVLSIRAAKNNLIRQDRPDLFGVPDKISSQTSIDPPSTTPSPIIAETPYTQSSQWDNLRRHVRSPSKKTPQGSSDHSTNDFTQTNSPVTPGPFKSGSLLSFDEKNLPIKPTEVEQLTFAKGSLLASNDTLFEQAKERERIRRANAGIGIIKDPNGNTFVQLDDTVKFNKGSLLSKSYNETNQSPTGNSIQINTIRFNEGSLLAKSKEQSPSETSPTRTGLLVQIDEGVRYNKGSLLAKSKEQSPSETSPTRPGLLVQIDYGVQFNKGSLLAKSKEQSPVDFSPTHKNYFLQADEGVRFNEGSLLAKEQSDNHDGINRKLSSGGPLLTIDTPITSSRSVSPKTTPITTGRTLLEIDAKPDTKHTISLRNANIQPLLSFIPGENQRNNNNNGNSSTKLRFDESEEDSEEDTDYNSNDDDSDST